MAHELEIIDGQAQMFSAGGVVPWHGLGTIIEDDAVRASEALTLAGLDWTVEKVPVAQEIGVDEETGDTLYDTVDGFYSVQRSSDLRSVGIVGERYVPLDNVDAFQFGDDLLDQHEGAHWITAGSLKDGKVVWMLAELPETINISGMEDEAIKQNILISNSHDGSTAVSASITPVRVVCNNTLTLALKGTPRTFKIRHTKNISGRINEAKRVLGIAEAYAERLQAVGTTLINSKFSDAEFEAFLESLVPTKGKDEGRSLTVATIKQEAIRGIYRTAPDLQNIKGTKWGSLQAVIDFNDHHIKGRGEGKAENRMNRILNQPNITHEAFNILLNM